MYTPNKNVRRSCRISPLVKDKNDSEVSSMAGIHVHRQDEIDKNIIIKSRHFPFRATFVYGGLYKNALLLLPSTISALTSFLRWPNCTYFISIPTFVDFPAGSVPVVFFFSRTLRTISTVISGRATSHFLLEKTFSTFYSFFQQYKKMVPLMLFFV